MNKNRKMVVEIDGIKGELYLVKTTIEEIIHLYETHEDFNIVDYKEE
jgi:hypothetical protein